MDRLKELYEEYCEQLYKPQKAISSNKAKTAMVKDFLDMLAKPKKRKTIFQELPDAVMNDEKSVDLIMRDDLHNVCFMDRCFGEPKEIKS